MPVESQESWAWKMEYCRRNGIPSAEKWAWDKAEKAFQDATARCECEEDGTGTYIDKDGFTRCCTCRLKLYGLMG